MLTISSAKSQSDFYIKLGDEGLRVDPSKNERQIEKQEQEAWCARRLLTALIDNSVIEYPVSITQREEPDFEITENKKSYWLEITQAISEVDARERSLAAKKQVEFYCIGDFGGRKAQDDLSSAAEITCNIQAAINKKSTKGYVRSKLTDLLIYIEGNNVIWLDSESADEESKAYQNLICTFPYENTDQFKRIFFLWNSGKIFQLGSIFNEKRFSLSADMIHLLRTLT